MRNDAQLLRRRNRELSILNAIAEALNQSVNLTQTLTAVLAEVAQLLDLETGWIWLFHEGTTASYLAADQNLPPVLAENPQKMMGSCYCLRNFVQDNEASAANINVIECSRLSGVVDGTAGLLYHASIPVMAYGKKLGVLNVAGADWRGLSAEDLQLLHTIGDMLGIGVERARLFAQSSRMGALEERNRLAREIHDTLAQGLTAVSLQLESADALLDIDGDRAKIQATIQQALALTRANLEEARRSVMDLRATELEDHSLIDLLNQWVKEQPYPFKIKLALDSPPLPPGIETGIYRILQEALNNIVRHAEAKHVKIQLRHHNDTLNLLVSDDGKGFDPNNIAPNRFGLIGMSERAKLMNGRLHISTNRWEGTDLQVEVPLSEIL